MSTNQQRREAAKRKLERQQARRVQQAQRRKRVVAITAAVVVVAVVAATAAFTLISAGGGSSAPSSAAPPSSTAATPPAGPCSFPATPDQPAARPVTAPTDTNPPRQGTVAVTMTTSQGVLPLTLDRAAAPCTVESFLGLAQAGFFNNTPCHRLVDLDTLKALQCGDPTGTGSGGPGYTVPDEPPTNLKPVPGSDGSAIYPAGTIAMAKTDAPNSGGSQFFLVYADSQLPPTYTVFGTIGEPGLKVLQKIAAAGDDGSMASSAGGGKPKLATTIQTVSAGQ
ncbi:MAG TPA: peptidylprolyl isomerase [Pseudonocardia sp.]|uniref:peptidylprolyl isomerase n=1 Tax=Pseudonocardia sp. TaxID=60912 RepID=UPI002F3F2625